MRIVFVGAGSNFWGTAVSWIGESPENSEFFFVDPAVEKIDGLRKISLKEAVEIANFAVIATPSYVRWKVCSPFIEKGVPIAVEKPLALSWEEIKLFERAKDSWICPILNARSLQIVEDYMWTLRGVTFVEATKERSRSPGYYEGWHGKFATDGGVLAQQGFHCLDLVCAFGGTPTKVLAMGERRQHKIECEDTAKVLVRFANGASGVVTCTTAGIQGLASLLVSVPGSLFYTQGPIFVPSTEESGHSRLARKIFWALAAGGGPPISVEEALPALKAMHAAYISMDAKEPTWVDVGEGHKRLGVSSEGEP